MKNILEKLVMNSQKAIDDGVYDIVDTLSKSEIDLEESIRNNVHASLITETLQKSEINLEESIKNNVHASLITEIKFSSPAEGNIRHISDPLQIAESMISGGAKALSI